MKKRVLALILIAVMLLTAVGCGSKKDTTTTTNNTDGNTGSTSSSSSKGDTTDDRITLSYWGYDDEAMGNYLAEAFMKLHPNIKVEYRVIEDMSTDLSAAAAAKNFPDVFEGTDSDTALANQYWLDISEYFDNDPENKNLMPTLYEYGIGCFDTSKRYAVPMKYWPSAVFVDKNVLDKLNIAMPRTDWTWDEMLQLIKDATVDDRSGMKYYGLGYYNRLDSLYGIAATSKDVRPIKGEFGYNGEDFDLSYWAIGEQQFSDLKLGGYVAPQQNTQAMEDWSGDWTTWFGATGHVAVFSEGSWTYQNLWGLDGYQEQYGLDIYPYVTPNVIDEKEHNVIANMYMGGVSLSCKHPAEAYELLKFFGWGIDGWKARLDIYEDASITNASGTPLKAATMPYPLTLDEGVWARFKALFPQDEAHKSYWDDYFASITRPVPYGWYNIAGYWNFCDQYFNNIGIHDRVDEGTAKAADYAAEATEKANYYHAEAMISYFGPDGYDILSADEIAKYQAVVDAASR